MNIFSTKSTFHWLQLNSDNIKKYLMDEPYLQSDHMFAICPYCRNVIKINSKSKSNHFGIMTKIWFASHIHHSPDNFPSINMEKLDFWVHIFRLDN